MSFIEFIVTVGLGFWIGLWYMKWAVDKYTKNLQEKGKDALVDVALEIYKKHTIPLKIEKVNDSFYCYNNENDEYVCRGNTFDEVKTNFKERFPDHGSYILQEYLHFFPEVKDMIVDDPTDEETKARLLKELDDNSK